MNEADIKEKTLRDSIYIKHKPIYCFRTVVILCGYSDLHGGTGWEGFWGAGSVLFLELGAENIFKP